MKLSTRSEYACLALIDLAQHRGEGYVHTAAIAERQEVPKQYLEQILLILKGAGYVRSRRGTGGGWQLSGDPAAISMAEVIRLLDGALAPVESVSRYFYEPTPISRNPALLEVFREIRDYVSDKLESTNFAELAGEQAGRPGSIAALPPPRPAPPAAPPPAKPGEADGIPSPAAGRGRVREGASTRPSPPPLPT